MYIYVQAVCVERIFQASNFLPTLFPPEGIFVVDHALDDGAHGHAADQLVSQRRKLGTEVHLHVQTRRGGHDHIPGLESERVERVKIKSLILALAPLDGSREQDNYIHRSPCDFFFFFVFFQCRCFKREQK